MTVLGPQPAPLCRFKGVRGEIEIPPVFLFRGPGGHSLFKREYPLLLRTETVQFRREPRYLCAKDSFSLPQMGISLREQKNSRTY